MFRGTDRGGGRRKRVRITRRKEYVENEEEKERK